MIPTAPPEQGTCSAFIYQFCDKIQLISVLALSVIACIGAGGVLPGLTIGGTILGLAGVVLLCTAIRSPMQSRNITAVHVALMLLPIVLGSLGVAGILSGVQVGLGMLIVGFLLLSIACCACCNSCLDSFRDGLALRLRQARLAREP